MDNIVAGLILLGLIAFSALCIVESCCRPEPPAYQQKQEAAEARGDGEYFIDRDGVVRFRYYSRTGM
jgi:hypothetical protein